MKFSQGYGLLVFILSFFIFQNCKKSSPPAPEKELYASFSRNALQYLQLTEGKYLIYKDSATSLLDSVVVTKCRIEVHFTPGLNTLFVRSPAYYTESLTLILSKFDGSSETEWLRSNAFTSMWPAASSVSIDTADIALIDESGGVIVYATETFQSKDTVTVEGKTYSNAQINLSDNGLDPSDQAYRKSIYYWAKGIGIVKRTIVTGGVTTTHTLLRNN
ncbi:MAG: hypothetical protein ACXWCG_01575 [Flavitalea sp.]